jgi:hypothetical protein
MAEGGELTPDTIARVRLAETLWNDPETRPLVEQAIAKKFPGQKHNIPGYQEREEMTKLRAEMAEEREAIRREREAERRDAAFNASRRTIVDDPTLRIREEELPHVEKIMSEESVLNHRAAAEIYRAREAAAAPARRGGYMGGMQVPGENGAGGDYFKGIIANPEAWAREKAGEIINDFASGRGHLHNDYV